MKRCKDNHSAHHKKQIDVQPISDQQPPWKDSIFTAEHDGIEYCFGQFGFAVPAVSPQPLACL